MKMIIRDLRIVLGKVKRRGLHHLPFVSILVFFSLIFHFILLLVI